MSAHRRLRVPILFVCALGVLLASVACIFAPNQPNSAVDADAPSDANATPDPNSTSDAGLTDQTPRWSCPTPRPKPTIQVEDGTKPNAQGTPETHYRDTEPYEREYGRPVVRPTVYSRSGEGYFFNQIVNFSTGVDMQLTVKTTTKQTTSDPPYVLALVTVVWTNGGQPFTFDPGRQVVVSAVKQPNGRLAGGTWSWSREAAVLAGTATDDSTVLHQTIGTGETTITLPVLIPVGTVEAADVRLDQQGASAQHGGTFRIHFSPGSDPNCNAAGTMGAVYAKEGKPAAPLAVPAGTGALVASALSQVGRQYCWGGKGYTPCSGKPKTPPCASYPCFDCSGLMFWAYGQNGIPIMQGTVNQQKYPEVPIDHIQPGDLMLFSDSGQRGRGSGITHVGMYAGDLNGDGTGDLIHAFRYPDGILITNSVLANPWYKTHLAIITRPPRGERK